MGIHLVVGSFDGIVDTDNSSVLHYLGFNPDTAEKEINGETMTFVLNTKTDGISMNHLFIKDDKITTDNLVVVFPKPINKKQATLFGLALSEIAVNYKLDINDNELNDILITEEGLMGCYFKNIGNKIMNQIAAINRRQLTVI